LAALGIIGAALALIAPIAAQSQPQKPQPEPPVFRSGVRLVRLDLRVVDNQGRAIADLRPDELRVTEGDVNRPIVLFQRVAGSGDSYVESAQRTIASEVSTNQGAPQGHLFVLLFDQDHISSGNEQPVRAAADAFLRDHVRRHDRVAVYGLPGPGPAQWFTANMTAAREQLANVRGGLERRAHGPITEMSLVEAYEIVRGNETVLSRFTTVNTAVLTGGDRLARTSPEQPAVVRRLIQENAQTIVNRADDMSRHFLRATADLLRSLNGIDGRKTVLLFSEGFYANNVARELEDVASAAAEAYAVVYALDLNKRLDLVTAETTTADDPGEIDHRLVPLGNLASETSGELFKDASVRLSSVFTSVLPDESYYLIGFEPAPDTTDSQYRRIKVNIARAGAKVLSRTGYALGAAPTPATRRRAIDAALGAPFTQQGLKLEYTTYIGQSMTQRLQRVALSVSTELPVLPDRPAGRDDSAADVVFVVRDIKTGRVAASGSDQIPLPARAQDGFRTGVSSWRTAFEIPSGDYIMRCVVREPGGIVGSADRRFVVKQMDGSDVAASDLVLSSPGDPFPVRVRAFTESPLTGTARLYARSSDKLQPLTGHLDLLPIADVENGPAMARGATVALGPVIDTLSGARRDVLLAVPLSGLAAGPYVARLVIRSGSETVATLQRPVDIVVGIAPEPPAAARSESRPSDVLSGQIGHRLLQRLASSQRNEVRQAVAFIDQRNWSAAIRAASTAPADDFEAACARGLADLGREEYAAAATTLSAQFDAHPDDAALAFVLGWARRATGDTRGAIGAFRNAAHLEPAMVPAHLALASTYRSVGQTALAVQALESGLRQLPSSPELQAMLAEVKK
jgi:VWFA-related protein